MKKIMFSLMNVGMPLLWNYLRIFNFEDPKKVLRWLNWNAKKHFCFRWNTKYEHELFQEEKVST